MPKAILIFALAVLGTGAAMAADTLQSNIALLEYPGPPCTKPGAPAPPQLPQDQSKSTPSAPINLQAQNEAASAEAYNRQVRQYNKTVSVYNSAVKEFNSCMKTYMDNGNADMQRIKQRLDQAVADANAH